MAGGGRYKLALGDGGIGSDCWLNPRMDSLWHPIERLQKAFYLNAACAAGHADLDRAYVARLLALHAAFPAGAKLMLLAFDWHHDENGRRIENLSPFHTPNDYAQRLARERPQHFEWIASVHPYRTDALEALEQAARNGARAMKWLPSAQGMVPADARCDRFYEQLVRLKLPLLTHAGSRTRGWVAELPDREAGISLGVTPKIGFPEMPPAHYLAAGSRRCPWDGGARDDALNSAALPEDTGA